MAIKFNSKFFSLSGQKERLKNVIGVLKAPFTGGKVVSNTGIKFVDKALGTAANHPIATAAVAGTIVNLPKAVATVKKFRDAKSLTPLGTAKGGVIGKNVDRAMKKGSNAGLLNLNELGSQSTPPPPSPSSGGLLEKLSPSASKTYSTSTGTRKRRKTSAPRRSRRRTSPRRSRRRGYGTAKQYARKGGKSVKYTKNGQPYIILSDGRARFVKGRRKK